MGATVTFFVHPTPSLISTTFQLPLSKNTPDVAKQQNSLESMSGWQMGASISCGRESLTSITHHFLLELVLTEYYENPNQHVEISKQNFFFKALSCGLYLLLLKLNYKTMRERVRSKLRTLCKFNSVCASVLYHLSTIVNNYFTEITITISVEKFQLILASMISQ